MTGTPACAASFLNRLETWSGSHGRPSAWQKIRSLSCRAARPSSAPAAAPGGAPASRSVVSASRNAGRSPGPALGHRLLVQLPAELQDGPLHGEHSPVRSAKDQRNPHNSARRFPPKGADVDPRYARIGNDWEGGRPQCSLPKSGSHRAGARLAWPRAALFVMVALVRIWDLSPYWTCPERGASPPRPRLSQHPEASNTNGRSRPLSSGNWSLIA